MECLWLDSVRRHKPITKEAANILKTKKLVEGRYPNLIISKKIAKETHAEIEYTDMKGMDDQYYRDFILNALTQHGKLRRSDFNKGLINKLPSVLSEKQKISKVGNLLSTLRKEGKIIPIKDKYWILKGLDDNNKSSD
jgi:ATP-dependent DNA helicase RecG